MEYTLADARHISKISSVRPAVEQQHVQTCDQLPVTSTRCHSCKPNLVNASTSLSCQICCMEFTAARRPALQCLEEEASKLGLHVSWAKTKVQNFGSGHEAAPITVNGEVVEVVNSFVYLGSTISSGSNSHSEVMRRIGLASSVIDHLSRIWLQRHLSLTTKCRLYSSCILAVLLYASETWTLTKSD